MEEQDRVCPQAHREATLEEWEISSPTSFRKQRFLDEGHVAEVTKTNQGIDLCIDLRGQDWGGNRHSSGNERQMHNRGNSSRKEASIPDNVGDENQLVTTEEPNDIRKNPTFISQFPEMCAKVGVDPLASNKGFWAELLGIGDFYYEIDDCLRAISKLKAQGFVTVDEVERRLSWTPGCVVDALDTLLDDGLAMIDDGHRDGKRRYWFPCVSSITSSVLADS
ncbi:hypothetical protein QYF36_026179 [Acer negundo]|nr:hypothetical protein QYF36_026179 [Acer negundo]